jgi:hypothetical protein
MATLTTLRSANLSGTDCWGAGYRDHTRHRLDLDSYRHRTHLRKR